MRIGVLTGGGDCPGLNPVILAVVRKALLHNCEVIGLLRGWAGLIEKDTIKLTRNEVSGILPRGGTILRTSRTNPYKNKEDVGRALKNYKELGLDALIAIGGEDTLGVAFKLYKEGLNIVGVPKTIDNDLSGTDCTFGFDTAINICVEAIDRLHTTAESHNRVMIVEIMGRHAGWIALESGLAGGADIVLIPEVSVSIDEICKVIKKRHEAGKDFSIIAVAEGAKLGEEDIIQSTKKDAFGHVKLGGIAHILAKEIEKRMGYETRVTVLGHVQRGGSPTAFDRFLGLRFGVKAVELVLAGEFGKMVSLKGNNIESVNLQDAVAKIRTVPKELYETAKIFFG